MKRLLMAVLAVGLFASTAFGQISFSATLYQQVIDDKGVISYIPVEINIKPTTTTPGPIDPQPPVTDLYAKTKAAHAAVPNYGQKELHTKAMAFSLNVVSRIVSTSTKPVGDSVTTIRSFADQVTGSDAENWTGFWGVVEPELKKAATSKELAAKLAEVQRALEDAIPQSDCMQAGEEFLGADTYGLQTHGEGSWWEIFLPILLKFLEKLLEQLISQSAPYVSPILWS